MNISNTALARGAIPYFVCFEQPGKNHTLFNVERGQENFASDPCELAFICVLLAITCVPINAFMIASMRVITYECELNLLTRLPQNFLDPYEA